MSAKVWNVVIDTVGIPAATNGQASRPFSVPNGARMVSMHIPDLVGVATTVLLQALYPPENEGDAEVWTPVSVFDLTDGTIEALDAIPENAVTTLPATATGGGVLRFFASAAQTGAPDQFTIKLVWGIDP